MSHRLNSYIHQISLRLRWDVWGFTRTRAATARPADNQACAESKHFTSGVKFVRRLGRGRQSTNAGIALLSHPSVTYDSEHSFFVDRSMYHGPYTIWVSSSTSIETNMKSHMYHMQSSSFTFKLLIVVIPKKDRHPYLEGINHLYT